MSGRVAFESGRAAVVCLLVALAVFPLVAPMFDMAF